MTRNAATFLFVFHQLFTLLIYLPPQLIQDGSSFRTSEYEASVIELWTESCIEELQLWKARKDDSEVFEGELLRVSHVKVAEITER